MANEALEKLAKLGMIDSLAAAVSTKITEVEGKIPTKTSQLTNDSTYQTEQEVTTAIAAQIGRVYKPAGTIAFAALPELTEANLGNVYNISDKFTTDERFVEGAGGKHPAGTNVAVVQVGEDFKFDVLAGAVDLSNYVEKDGDKVLSDENYTVEEKTKLAGIAEGATKVEASTTEGNIVVNGAEVPVVEIANDEEAAAVINKYFPTNT